MTALHRMTDEVLSTLQSGRQDVAQMQGLLLKISGEVGDTAGSVHVALQQLAAWMKTACTCACRHVVLHDVLTCLFLLCNSNKRTNTASCDPNRL